MAMVGVATTVINIMNGNKIANDYKDGVAQMNGIVPQVLGDIQIGIDNNLIPTNILDNHLSEFGQYLLDGTAPSHIASVKIKGSPYYNTKDDTWYTAKITDTKLLNQFKNIKSNVIKKKTETTDPQCVPSVKK